MVSLIVNSILLFSSIATRFSNPKKRSLKLEDAHLLREIMWNKSKIKKLYYTRLLMAHDNAFNLIYTTEKKDFVSIDMNLYKYTFNLYQKRKLRFNLMSFYWAETMCIVESVRKNIKEHCMSRKKKWFLIRLANLQGEINECCKQLDLIIKARNDIYEDIALLESTSQFESYERLLFKDIYFAHAFEEGISIVYEYSLKSALELNQRIRNICNIVCSSID